MAELYAGVAASGVWKPPETAVEIAKMLRAGSIYAEKAFLRVMNQEYGAKGLYQITKTPVGLEYFKKIHEYLTTTLSAKLEPFAYEKPFFFEEGL